MKTKRWLPLSSLEEKLYAFQGVMIFAGLLLTTVSFLKLCSKQCAEGHNYLLFGFPFEIFGLIFFAGLFVMHIFQKQFKWLQEVEFLLFSSALGAEAMFIAIQKYTIGKWCPVCLGIAAIVLAGTLSFAWLSIHNHKKQLSQGNKGDKMGIVWTGLRGSMVAVIGFLVAFFGVSKFDAMQAAENKITESLAFGNPNSQIEAYLFTDWACPACRKIEHELKKLTEAIGPQAKVIFVDHAVHPTTLNYIPYNLSFIIKNKDHYFELRDMLTELSVKTGSPTESQVAAEAEKLGVTYQELNYADIALAIKYYKKLAEKFNIQGTPTLVIINRSAKKGKKLTGNKEITEENALKAIQKLKGTG